MVSVIIPNYNHSFFLSKRIESVLNQTIQDLEVIILDDFSSDNSRDIIDLYKSHPKVTQIIYNEVNSGSLFKQWEKGIKLAKGDFIWIAESDDYAHPCFLEKLVPLIEADESTGLVYCNTKVINQNDELCADTYADIRNRMLNTSKWSSSYQLPGIEEIEENLLNFCTINNASAVVFKREALLKVNPFDRGFKYVGDWYCYLKLCKEYSIKYLNEPLNFYRIHPVNASKGLDKNFQFLSEHFNLFDWVFRNLSKISTDKKVQMFDIYVKHNLFKGWSLDKIVLYKKLYNMNPMLFRLMIKSNLHRLIVQRKFLKI